MVKKAVAVSILIVVTVCLPSIIPVLADAPGFWSKTDGLNEITPALTEGTATFEDDEAREFVHQIQSWGGFGSQTFATALEALNWVYTKISYVEDNVNYGVTEAWANPEQTLNQGSGDCEDLAFLLASLLKWHTSEVNIVGGDLVYTTCGFLLPPDGEFHAWVFWWDVSAADWHQLDPTSGAMNHVLYPALGTLWLNDEHVYGFLPGYYPVLPTPIPGYDFVKISESGFVDSESEGRHNSYAWSMDVLPTPDADYLYVGSNRDFIYGLVSSLFTEEEIAEIFEGDIPIPVPLEPPCYLPDGSPVPDWRGRIFRCQDHDPDSWEIAYISPEVPHPAVNCTVPRYTGYRAMKTFTDSEGETALYVATTNLPAFPSHMLKFGQDYVPGTEPEIVGQFPGLASIRSMVVHDGKLYASSFGTAGLQVWASDNPALGNWTQVANASDFPLLPEIPPAYPRDISAMESFNGSLYVFAGTVNLPPGIHPSYPSGVPGGFWVYKSDNPAIGNWQETMKLGAGDYWNEGVSDARVFGDYVYVGTAIAVVQHFERLVALEGQPEFEQYLLYLAQNWKGGDILRFDSDDNWELVIGDPARNTLFDTRVGDFGPGFGNPANVYLWWTEAYQDELYVGTFDCGVFLKYLKNFLEELYPEELGEIMAETDMPQCAEALMGADLWVTGNGTHWNPITLNGFDNMYNYGVRTLLASDEGLFLGTANPFYGAEVWWKAGPVAGSTDALGARRDVFITGEDVYAAGGGFPPNTEVDVYIVGDLAWSDGDAIPDDVGDGMETLSIDDYGNLGPSVVWQEASMVGEYDMVFDADQDKVYDAIGDCVDHPGHPGFIVVMLPVGGEVYPVNRFSVLAPWVGLLMLLIGGLGWLSIRRHVGA